MHGQQNIKINRLVLPIEVESVFCAVRTESYIKQMRFVLKSSKYFFQSYQQLSKRAYEALRRAIIAHRINFYM